METLRQGIIRPACQARRVWHVVKRPPQLSPKNSLSLFPPVLPSLPVPATVANPPEGGGRRGCKNTCISTEDNDYHGGIPRNTEQRNFYGTSRREILQNSAKSHRLMKLYSDVVSYAGSSLALLFSAPYRRDKDRYEYRQG